jgi:hypothetical protein
MIEGIILADVRDMTMYLLYRINCIDFTKFVRRTLYRQPYGVKCV